MTVYLWKGGRYAHTASMSISSLQKYYKICFTVSPFYVSEHSGPERVSDLPHQGVFNSVHCGAVIKNNSRPVLSKRNMMWATWASLNLIVATLKKKLKEIGELTLIIYLI